MRVAFAGPRFHEAVLLLDRPVPGVLEALAARGIVGGCDLTRDYPSLGHRAAGLRHRDPHGTRTSTRTPARSRDVMQSAAAA